ncbi:MAG: hypothetical protein H6678_11920 [Candidatus Delongbacteria bacterium]|nr:hypothetical protein [Candidatus Delongbacteria bacterium]
MRGGPHHYAELHYAPVGPAFSRVWQDWPEVYLDAPWLLLPDEPLPLFMVWRDAHLFPCRIHSLRLRWLDPDGRPGQQALGGDWSLSEELAGVELGHFRPQQPGTWDLWIDGVAERHGRTRSFCNQLARGFAEHPLRITVAPGPDPRLPGLAWGDLQVHSAATRDPVEFGPPLPLLKSAARAGGLDWFCVTDHSYDLDDREGPGMGSDPAWPRWHRLRREILQLNSEGGARILLGEELSCGGLEGGILHLLLLAPPRPLAGSSDNGEGLPFRRAEHSLLDALEAMGDHGLAVASHPGEAPGRLEGLLLRRRDWSLAELRQLGHWQALNGLDGKSLAAGLDKARKLWSEGWRGVLLAGNDSHGNFALGRELTLPLLGVRSHRGHLFGRHRSGILTDEPTPDRVLEELRAGRVLLGNGPVLCFQDGHGTPVFTTEAGPRELLALAGGRLGLVRCVELLEGGPEGERVIQRHRPHSERWSCPLPVVPERGWLRARMACDEGFALTNPLFGKAHGPDPRRS